MYVINNINKIIVSYLKRKKKKNIEEIFLMYKVVILMSAYNGALYIEEQLDSIFEQTYQNFELLIRDDASTDNTVEIIENYKRKHEAEVAGRLTIISDNQGNIGYMRNFWNLLKESSDADVYAFCDQDDVWEPVKLERGVQCLEGQGVDIPLLYTSRFAYYSGDMVFQEEGIRYPYNITFDKVAFYTPAFGFTIMINDKLRQKALSASDLTDIPHDAWCLKIASSFGKVIYDEAITAKYRRHSATVTHASASKLKLTQEWIKKDVIHGNMRERYWFLTRFLEEYGEELPAQDIEFIKIFGEQKDSLALRIKRFCYKSRFRPTMGGEIALRICFLLGM